MLFNLKSAFLLGLVTFASAAPVALLEADPEVSTLHHLEARAAIPQHGVKCGTKIFTHAHLQAAVRTSRTRRGKYPAGFKNHGRMFDNHLTPATNLLEYPMSDRSWTDTDGGNAFPGMYRVVVNKNHVYVGALIHVGLDNFRKCTAAPAPAPACAAHKKRTARNLWGLVERATKKKTTKDQSTACEKPTKKPTKAPTKTPTKKPTKQPTKKPTKKPAKKPAKKPTKPKGKKGKGGKL